jgi:hypothetical protein
VESASKLQRAHIAGPQVHEAHLPVFVDWLRDNRIMLTEQAGRIHPFSSNYTVDLNVRLAASADLPLTIGKYLPLVDDIEVPSRGGASVRRRGRARADQGLRASRAIGTCASTNCSTAASCGWPTTTT